MALLPVGSDSYLTFVLQNVPYVLCCVLYKHNTGWFSSRVATKISPKREGKNGKIGSNNTC